MRCVLVSEGSGPLMDLPLDSEGHPFIPSAGDYIRVNGKLFRVTSVLWNFDEHTLYVAAIEELLSEEG